MSHTLDKSFQSASHSPCNKVVTQEKHSEYIHQSKHLTATSVSDTAKSVDGVALHSSSLCSVAMSWRQRATKQFPCKLRAKLSFYKNSFLTLLSAKLLLNDMSKKTKMDPVEQSVTRQITVTLL